VRRVTGDIFIIFDADEVIEASAVEHMVATFDNPQVAAVTGCTIPQGQSWTERGNRIVALAAYQTLKRKDSTSEHMSGGCLACRTDVIRNMGGFSSEDELAEDAEITWRLQDAGWKVIARDDVIAYHNAPVGLWEIFKWGARLGRLGAHTRLRHKEKFIKWHLLIRFGPLGLLTLLPFRPKLASLGLTASLLLFLIAIRNIPGSVPDKFFGWIIFFVKTLGWSITFIINIGIYLQNYLKND
jgi:cellulose synthase/poly-beta-1,6-N-acetylglucosamine synthase-like glycosyltransferase